MSIEISYKRFNDDNVPIISDKQIEDLVNNQLLDYDPNYFDRPHPIDLEDFIEFYLCKNVFYYKLSNNENILGITTLNDGYINIFNDDESKPLPMKRGEICIDYDACKNEELFRFTLAHEAGHSVLHAGYNLRITHLEDFENTIKTSKKRLITSNDWIEHHANIYASCLLMPSCFVKTLFDKYYGKHKKGTFSFRIFDVINKISKELKVSPKAIQYKLINLNLYDFSEDYL